MNCGDRDWSFDTSVKGTATQQLLSLRDAATVRTPGVPVAAVLPVAVGYNPTDVTQGCVAVPRAASQRTGHDGVSRSPGPLRHTGYATCACLKAEDRMSKIPPGTAQLIAWLDDAHAMESGLIPILQTHAAHFGDRMPQAARRLQQHVVETQQHAQRLQECLRMLNASPSGVKSTLSSLIGSVEGASTAMFDDQLVKDALADYASEQFEVGCYTALVSAATELGHADVARLCEQNLRDDQTMATWVLQQLPAVVSQEAINPATARARA
jgi:ferritin-like metal-binding protein YciE